MTWRAIRSRPWGKGATLFLGWMISIMKSLSPAVVIVSFVVLGVGMFLLPPVPGPPVYLTGGVLLVGSLEDSMGFWAASAVCIAVCWRGLHPSCSPAFPIPARRKPGLMEFTGIL